jgi:hypothetical protein
VLVYWDWAWHSLFISEEAGPILPVNEFSKGLRCDFPGFQAQEPDALVGLEAIDCWPVVSR